jgi:hypothetical protein
LYIKRKNLGSFGINSLILDNSFLEFKKNVYYL